MLLSVENLSVSYGAVTALHDVSFNVSTGEIVTIIGANGAGKSTIMNTLSGLVRPDKGCILFNGRSIEGAPPHEIVAQGLVQVPEGRGIFSALTVLENLEVATTARKNRSCLVADYAHVFELFPRLAQRKRQMAGTLSGGEQQMLAVGRALISRGTLLLLDEPSMGLAPALVDDIFAVIQRINHEGTTILLVEQNACTAMSVAHSAYVLENGRIVLNGKASELKDNPRVKKAYLGG